MKKTEHDDPFVRWNEHIREAQKERSKNRALYRAINKYGFNSFKFEVIEKTSNPEECEIFYINQFDTYKNGYNETLGGDGTAYLNLPEKEICKKYSMYKSISQLACEYNCDHTSIRKILLNNNIKLHPLGSHLLKKLHKLIKTPEKLYIFTIQSKKLNKQWVIANTSLMFVRVKGKLQKDLYGDILKNS